MNSYLKCRELVINPNIPPPFPFLLLFGSKGNDILTIQQFLFIFFLVPIDPSVIIQICTLKSTTILRVLFPILFNVLKTLSKCVYLVFIHFVFHVTVLRNSCFKILYVNFYFLSQPSVLYIIDKLLTPYLLRVVYGFVSDPLL